MPFPFSLPTTSQLSFHAHYSSSTHPSLISTATSYRSILRSALKKHKRLSPTLQPGHLPTISSALNEYLPYLIALDAGLSGRRVAGEEVDIALHSDIAVEWRPTLSASQIPTREAARVKGMGLDYELSYVIHTLATVNILLAREQLLTLYAEPLPTTEQRVTAIQNATKHILTANSLHCFLVQRQNSSETSPIPSTAVDVQPTTQSALTSLTLAEATLLFVLKDDPYPALTIQSRSKTDKEWMIKAPEIPKVRAHLFARLSLAAADHAAKAAASLSPTSGKVNPDLPRYIEDLRRVCRARACRFLGLDADLSGETGKGIAWLRAGLNELGISATSSSAPSFSKLKSTLQQSSRSLTSSSSAPSPGSPNWGIDAGKHEESLTLSLLEKKWVKMNDTINVQIIPDPSSLTASMPSGRDVHTSKAWKPVQLEAGEVARMRAPPVVDQDEIGRRLGGLDPIGDSSDEEDEDREPVGAFPGTRGHYASRSGTEAGDGSGNGNGDGGSGYY